MFEQSGDVGRTKLLLVAIALAVAALIAALMPAHAYAAGELTSGSPAKGLNSTGAANTVSLYNYYYNHSSNRLSWSSSRYDVTGDGIADNLGISLTPTSDRYFLKSMTITVNGKQALVLGEKYRALTARVKLVTLKNNKPFLFIQYYGNNMDGLHALYQYKNGTLKKVTDHNAFASKSKQANHRYISDVAVSGNTATVTYGYMTMFAGFVQIKQPFKYVSKSNALKKKASTTSKISYYAMGKSGMKQHKLKALKSFKVYSSTSQKRVKFTVKKGAKVKLVAATTKGGNLFFKVKSAGKTGWVKSKGLVKTSQNKYGGPWFKESMLAG